MSATEATPVVVVEEAKPSEVAPVTDTSAPVPEGAKVEAAAAPVRLFLCVAFIVPYFFLFLFQGGCEDRRGAGRPSSLLVISFLILLAFRKVLSLHQVRNLLPTMPNLYVLLFSNGAISCLSLDF